MTTVPKQRVAEEYYDVILAASDTVGEARIRYGTNDIVLIAYVDSDDVAEIRSATRAQTLEFARDKWAVAELTAWLEQEQPPTTCRLIIFDYRDAGGIRVYWVRLKVEGTLGVLN